MERFNSWRWLSLRTILLLILIVHVPTAGIQERGNADSHKRPRNIVDTSDINPPQPSTYAGDGEAVMTTCRSGACTTLRDGLLFNLTALHQTSDPSLPSNCIGPPLDPSLIFPKLYNRMWLYTQP